MLGTISDDQTKDREEDKPQAAEYVLGVHGLHERLEFERRMTNGPALRTEVEYWERRLGALACEVAAVETPARVWLGIEQAVGASASHLGLWNNLPFWRFAAIASAAAACIILIVGASRTPSPSPTLIAKLDVSTGQAGFIAAVDRGAPV